MSLEQLNIVGISRTASSSTMLFGPSEVDIACRTVKMIIEVRLRALIQKGKTSLRCQNFNRKRR